MKFTPIKGQKPKAVDHTDLTLLEDTPDVTTPETLTSGKQRFVFLRNAKSLTGFVILAFFLVLAVIGPWIAPY